MVYTIVVHLQAQPQHVQKLKLKLIEAASIYRKDKETLDWIVMQDSQEPSKFCIIERYEQESSQQSHLENPYRKVRLSISRKLRLLTPGQTFDPYVRPLLTEAGMNLTRWVEM